AWWFAATTIAHDLVVEGPPIAPLPLGWHVHPCATMTGGVTTPAAAAATVEAGPTHNPAANRPANSRILARRIPSSLTRGLWWTRYVPGAMVKFGGPGPRVGS